MNQKPDILDNTTVFNHLWEITNELRQKLEARFQLHPDSATQDLQKYSSLDGKTQGSLSAFSGGEIDRLVHLWTRNPEKAFSTMRLTTWLGSQIQVPHLAFEFDTFPTLFFYIDYIPRTELLTNLEYLDRYYEPVNETFFELQADSRLKPFVSKGVYLRQFLSPVSLCYTTSASSDTLELIRTVAHEMLDRWLTWVDEAEPVPEDVRLALATRDLFLRRAGAERDPGNKVAAQIFGAELLDKVVRSLWGGDRLP